MLSGELRIQDGADGRDLNEAVPSLMQIWIRAWWREGLPSALAKWPVLIDRFLAICEATDLQAATEKGDDLGWQRLTDAETEEWRTHFVGYNGGSVEAVGWRRQTAGQAEPLSFWGAVGPNGHTACTYSTARPDGLLDALSVQLGLSHTLEKTDSIEMISAYWKHGAVADSFTQIGSSITIAVGPSR